LFVAFFFQGTDPVLAAVGTPQVVVQSQAVVMSGGTPGGELILFSVAREPLQYAFRTATAFHAVMADGSGGARLDLPRAVVSRSMYAVIDVQTGFYTIATPADAEVTIETFPPKALVKKDGEFALLDIETRWMEAIVVRPKKGAWRISSLDGAPLDIDGLSNGRTAVAASTMTRVTGADETPGKFRAKDVVIVVDPRRMLVMATEVPE
jgi:hypothetical protein